MSEQRRHVLTFVRSQLLAGWMILLYVLVPAWCSATPPPGSIPVSGADVQSLPSDTEYTQAQLREETLGAAHDELIMLMISLVVMIQIIVSFKFLKWIHRRVLLLCSFGFLLLSAFCTVAEGLFLAETLNFLEHLSFMTSSILLVIWCWHVFVANKQEDG